MSAKFGYWNFRGLGQTIRNILKYSGEEYEERRYVLGPEPDFSRDDWLNEKETLGLKFPNIPYYIHGNVKLSQSLAILRYLGRKHGLIATTEEEIQAQDMVEQQLLDIRMAFVIAFLSSDQAKKLKEHFEKMPLLLKSISDHLGTDKWLVGDKVTYLDFLAHDILSFNSIFHDKSIEKFPNLMEYIERFRNLPKLKEYLESDEFKNLPPLPPEGYFATRR